MACRGDFNDRFQRIALGLHSDVTAMLEHLLRHVSGNVHDGLVADSTLGELRDQCAANHAAALSHGPVPYRISRLSLRLLPDESDQVAWISKRKQVPVRLYPVASQLEPFRMLATSLVRGAVQRNGAAFACVRFTFADNQESLLEIDLLPLHCSDLTASHPAFWASISAG